MNDEQHFRQATSAVDMERVLGIINHYGDQYQRIFRTQLLFSVCNPQQIETVRESGALDAELLDWVDKADKLALLRRFRSLLGGAVGHDFYYYLSKSVTEAPLELVEAFRAAIDHYGYREQVEQMEYPEDETAQECQFLIEDVDDYIASHFGTVQPRFRPVRVDDI